MKPQAPFSEPLDSQVDLQRPIFVVGVGRSGTSLLQSMLASHPSVVFPPETGMMRHFVRGRVFEHLFRQAGLDAVVERLEQDERIGNMEPDHARLVVPFRDEGRPFSDIGLYRELLRQSALLAGKPRVGDKDPRLIEYLPLVKRHFPDAMIIHVVRDPRDVLASKKKAAWSKNRNPLLHIFANRVQWKMGRKVGRKLFGKNYTEVVYESLIHSPQDELGRLCQWLGVPYEASMLEFASTAKKLVRPEELSWKKETLGPILKDNTEKWRSELSDWEIALSESLSTDLLAEQGYPRSDRAGQLPLFRRVLLPCVSTCLSGMVLLYSIYRRWTK
jgi:hypothetical protein